MIHQSTQRLIHGLSLCSLSLPHHASCVFLLRFQATPFENIKPVSKKIHQKTKNQPFFFRLPVTEKKNEA